MDLQRIKNVLESHKIKTCWSAFGVIVIRPSPQYVGDSLCTVDIAYNKDWTRCWYRIKGLAKNIMVRRTTDSTIELILTHYNNALEALRETEKDNASG
jgi:hypothetical protein